MAISDRPGLTIFARGGENGLDRDRTSLVVEGQILVPDLEGQGGGGVAARNPPDRRAPGLRRTRRLPRVLLRRRLKGARPGRGSQREQVRTLVSLLQPVCADAALLRDDALKRRSRVAIEGSADPTCVFQRVGSR